MKTPFSVLVLLLSVLLTSCVSKKKYLSLEEAKQRSDARARQLKQENDDLSAKLKTTESQNKQLNKSNESFKNEYNTLRNEMMTNNAQKTLAIDELNRKLTTLSGDKSALKDTLTAAIKRYQTKSEKLREQQAALQTQLANSEANAKAVSAYYESLAVIETCLNDKMATELKDYLAVKYNNELLISIEEKQLLKGDKLSADAKKLLDFIAECATENGFTLVIGAG
ncbi:MAG: hypothetical protein KDC92_15210, partial [Bacteroidetes bacterium]|nr:hypothetical protein [Bacteroidota bacterium]